MLHIQKLFYLQKMDKPGVCIDKIRSLAHILVLDVVAGKCWIDTKLMIVVFCIALA